MCSDLFSFFVPLPRFAVKKKVQPCTHSVFMVVILFFFSGTVPSIFFFFLRLYGKQAVYCHVGVQVCRERG